MTPLPRWIAPAMLGALTILFIVAFAPYLDGRAHGMGGDYSLFLTRMFSTFEWFGVNGIGAVPWFTPAFCGGMPEWGNPESMPYSLPQWLLFVFDPVWTLQITGAVYAIAGASGTWVLLRRGFRASEPAALLGATLFLFNAFFICRLIVGHVNFCVFMLSPWISWFLGRPANRWPDRVLNVLVPGALIALMVQAGAIAIMPQLGPAWLAVGLMHALRSPDLRMTSFLGRFSGGMVVAGLLSSSKLVAMAAFTGLFPRDFYALPGFRNIGGWMAAAIPSLFLRPLPDNPDDIVDILRVPGVQENDYSVSPVPLVLIITALIWRRRDVVRLVRAHWVLSAALAFMLFLPVALNLHGDAWTALLKKIPVLKSSSSLYRWLLLYIPVLTVGAALAVEVLPRRWIVAGIGIVVAVTFALTGKRDIYNGFPYDGRPLIAAWKKIHATGAVLPITRMHAPLGPDGMPLREFGAETAIVIGDNLVRCFEPLFGYQQEKLPWRPLHDGPALDVTNGLLNVKNPACEQFPVENHCKPGDHFPEAHRADAEAFLAWEPFPFERPMKQRVADALNVVALVAVCLGILGALLAHRRLERSALAPPSRE